MVVHERKSVISALSKRKGDWLHLLSDDQNKIFNKHNMKNMFDYLEYYNNCDVIPMVEAINKMFMFYRPKNLDMFKDAISLD